MSWFLRPGQWAQESGGSTAPSSPSTPSVGPVSNGSADKEPSHKMPTQSAAAKASEIVYAPDSNPEGRVGATETVTKGDVAKIAPASSLVALALRRRHLMKMFPGQLGTLLGFLFQWHVESQHAFRLQIRKMEQESVACCEAVARELVSSGSSTSSGHLACVTCWLIFPYRFRNQPPMLFL